MQSSNDNIYPIFNQIISKREKENRLKQNAKCIWLTGLSGSGKTTLALKLEKTYLKNLEDVFNFFSKNIPDRKGLKNFSIKKSESQKRSLSNFIWILQPQSRK